MLYFLMATFPLYEPQCFAVQLYGEEQAHYLIGGKVTRSSSFSVHGFNVLNCPKRNDIVTTNKTKTFLMLLHLNMHTVDSA